MQRFLLLFVLVLTYCTALGQTNTYYYDALLGAFIENPIGTPHVLRPLTDKDLVNKNTVQFIVVNVNPLYKLETESKSLTITYDVPSSPIPAPVKADEEPANAITKDKVKNCQLLMARITAQIADSKKKSTDAMNILTAFDQVDIWSKQYALDETTTHALLTKWSKDYFKAANASISAIGITLNSTLAELNKQEEDLTKFKTNDLAKNNYDATCKSEKTKLIDTELISLKAVRDELAARIKAMGKTPLYWVVLRDNEYTNRTEIIEMTGDKVSISSSIVSRPEFSELPNPKVNIIKKTFGVTRFWAIDVSAGVVATGLVDHDYYFQQSFKTVNTDSIINSQRYKTLKRRNTNEFLKPGIATFVHFRYKSKTDFSHGPTLGFTVLSNDSPVQYHLGYSILFGEKQRFAVTVGGTVGKVTRVSDGFSDGVQVPYSFSDLPTYQTWRCSWLVGLSYNLTSTVK